MFRHPLVAPANEGADRCRSGVENVDAIFLDDLPESIGLRPVRRAFVHEGRSAIGQWSVNDITMPGDPADIGRAPKNVFISDIEDIFGRRINADEVPAGRVQNSFWLPR